MSGVAQRRLRRAQQARRRLVEPTRQLAKRPPRVGQHAALAHRLQAVPLGSSRRLMARTRRRRSSPDRLGHRLLLAHDQLRRLRRRGRAHVGDEVGDRVVDLVADGGDHGDLAGRDRAREHLVVNAQRSSSEPPRVRR